MRSALATLALLVALAPGVSAQTEIDRLEGELERARGVERADVLNRLARATQSNTPERSIEYAREALEIARREDDRVGEARALNNIGIGHYLLADYPLALEYYKQSLAVAETLDDDRAVADALNNIGIIYYVWGDYDQALQYYSRVLELRQRTGDKKGTASAYNNLGNVHHATARYEESLEYLFEALPLYDELGEERLFASTLNNIALAQFKLGRLDEALERLETALAVEERLDDKAGVALTLNTIGMVYSSLERGSESLDHYRRSLAIRREIGDRQGIAICLHNIGQAYAHSPNPVAALPYLQDALEAAREIDVKEIERDVQLTLSDTYERLNESARALEAYKRYKEINDELFDQQTSKRLAEQQARYDVEKKDREIEVLRQNQAIQRIVRNVSLGGAALLICLVLLLYNRYRLKVRANREMRKANEALKLAQAEREKAMRSELTHVTRVATLGELAAALGHELNQPLTAILSNAQATRRVLASSGEPNATIDEALGDIVDGAGRAREIIKRLRALIRRGEITQEELDLNQVLREIEPIARVDAGRYGIELAFELSPKLPAVVGDRIQLQQIVLNLVHNGAEAMAGHSGGDGRVEVETAPGEGETVLVVVRDSGPGLEPEALERVFEPFFTTKQEGLGMGLTICSTIIDAHGGRLWLERNADRGLAAKFTVPAAPAK